MSGLLDFREKLINFYIKHGDLTLKALKFLIGLFVFYSMGYMSFGAMGRGKILALAVVFGLICTVISPFGFYLLTVAASAIYLYTVSVELCAVVIIVMFIIGVFYIRLFPKEALFIPAIMICFHFKIPYAIVIFAGIYAGFSGIVPVILGTLIWGVFVPCLEPMAKIAPKSEYALLSAPDKLMEMFAAFSINAGTNSGWLRLAVMYGIIIAIFVVLNKILIIYYMKEMSIFAMGIALIIVTLSLNGTYSMGLGAPSIIGGGIGSIIIMLVVRFFDNILDYKRSQRVQFEDDDYYYYVKAVPKIKNRKRARKTISGR